MADVSSFHIFHQPNVQEQEQEREPDLQTLEDSVPSWSNNTIHDDDDIYDFDFDPLSPSNTAFFVPLATHRQNLCPYTGSESDSDPALDSDCFHDEDDQMNFVTDLFASRVEDEYVADDRDSVSDPFLDSVTDDVNSRVFDGGDGFGSNYGDEPGFGFGSPVEFRTVGHSSETNASSANCTDGLRVVGMDSDSDLEEVAQDVNLRVHDDGTGPFGESDNPFYWDCPGFEEQRARAVELEWEEVEERIDERENLSLVINRIEELSVSSEISSNEETGDIGEEVVRSLEWEILLAVNNLERAHEFDRGSDDVSYLASRDDYIYEAEYDVLFGQFVQNESALKGSPPAAKAVVENLPSVVLTKEELLAANVVCAVCKDEISVEEEVTRLPCCHHYHGDCIVPWLCIRNTCPVCRYELPTDDLDYEQRKTQREGLSLPQDLQVLELVYGVADSE